MDVVDSLLEHRVRRPAIRSSFWSAGLCNTLEAGPHRLTSPAASVARGRDSREIEEPYFQIS